MSRPNRTRILSVLALALLAGAVTAVTAGAADPDPIQARQEAMEGVGDAMKGLSAIARGEAAFDAAVVGASARKIAENLHRASELFPPGSEKGAKETWAKPEIWSATADFDAKLRAAHDAATALAQVTAADAYRPAFAKLGGACKACHERYRRPKE